MRKLYEAKRLEDGTPAIIVTVYGDSIVLVWHLVNVTDRGRAIDWTNNPTVAVLSILTDHFLGVYADPAKRKAKPEQTDGAVRKAHAIAEHVGRALKSAMLPGGFVITDDDIDLMIVEASAPAVVELDWTAA